MAADYYDLLGVKRDAPQKELRAAFRRLARRYHPDVNPGNAEAEASFKRINEAYEVLSNAEHRHKYDRHGEQWRQADQIEEMRRRGGAAGQPFEVHFGGGEPGAGRFGAAGDLGDVGDLFGRGGGVFDSLLRRAAGRQHGEDLEHAVQITLEEAYQGTKRAVEVHEGTERCRVCGGAGQLAGATCHACRGSGSAAPVRRIEVQIPAGVQSGQRVRVKGRGAPGLNGGAAGDLLLHVEVRPHPRFERRGDDLHVEVDVPVADAALGGEVHVTNLNGKALALRVPAGTHAGKTFRLAGQGMPRAGGGFGDLHARVRLQLPEPLTAEQRALFERLRATTAAAGAAGPAQHGEGAGVAS